MTAITAEVAREARPSCSEQPRLKRQRSVSDALCEGSPPPGGGKSAASFSTPAPTAEPQCGSASRGDFVRDASDVTFVRAINRGAHSKVWLVMQRGLGLNAGYFALKVLSKARLLRAGEAEVQSVLREKRALLSLQPHPYIASLQATFQDGGSLYLLLQLGLGGDLRGVLLRARRRGVLSGSGAMAEEAVRFYVAVLVLVLQHVHGLGFAYRDLKPENVLLDAEGLPLLCDFGTAVHLGKPGRSMTALGTWEYAAPEQLERRGATCAVDWWALGVIALEALSGASPFPSGENDSPAAVLDAIAPYAAACAACTEADGLPPPHDGLSRAGRGLARSLLQPDERKRWAAARDVRRLPFFDGVDWGALGERQVPPPLTPTLLGGADTRNFSHCSLDESDAAAVGAPLSVEAADAHGGAPSDADADADGWRDDWHRSCWDGF